jgi:predicted phage baseplate assembly protein
MNERGGPAFQPFGASAGPNDVLVMEFGCRGDDGLFPPKRADAEGALLPIGVRADKSLTGDVADPGALIAAPSDSQETSPLAATLVTPTERVPLRIASDSSGGLLRTGALLLDLSAVKDSPTRFAIELRSARGFERSPRLLRIEPNVVPIVQGYSIPDEVHEAPGSTDEPNGGAGLPDWSFQLNVPGLRFAPSEKPVKIEQRDADTNRRTEGRPGRLAESAQNDPVYELDTAAERVTFGNGVNGRIPPPGATMLASYAVCDGEQGGVAANRKWRVQGFAGSFGVNLYAVTGGAAPTASIDERREARRRARDDHALVSSEDIVSAALHLPQLEVARAWVLTPGDKAPRTGTVNLVAMRARVSEQEAGGTPETRRWLEAIRRRLAPKMSLATRLIVTAPRYVDFWIRATIEVAAGRDPATIKGDIERELTQHLALTGTDARHPGVPVSKRDLIAWIRVVDGVRRMTSLALLAASGADTDEIKVPRDGLPRFDLAGSSIDVKRSGTTAVT